ncbi:MAG: hypothetical protein RQ735_02355 [Flavobacteriaceae bacterium]|nr:hypothetical protein [Flavobacteriaceae bacterium]
MNIQLIQGEFHAIDALSLITQLIHTKIKYHENKISNNSSEEDVKFRESKIKHLQKELYELRKKIHETGKNLKIDATIHVS